MPDIDYKASGTLEVAFDIPDCQVSLYALIRDRETGLRKCKLIIKAERASREELAALLDDALGAMVAGLNATRDEVRGIVRRCPDMAIAGGEFPQGTRCKLDMGHPGPHEHVPITAPRSA
jgi:hypothetical protein